MLQVWKQAWRTTAAWLRHKRRTVALRQGAEGLGLQIATKRCRQSNALPPLV